MPLLAGVGLFLAVIALITAVVAVRRVEQYKLTAPQIRELVHEIENALEKLAHQRARESMRRLRQQRTEEHEDPPEPPSEPPPRDLKGELWAIVRRGGMLPSREVQN